MLDVTVTIQQRIELIVQNGSSEPLRPWNAFAHLVTAMLQLGIPSESVILLLMLR